MAIRKATKQIAKTPGGVVLQCTGSINTDELIRIVDDRAVRSVVSTGFGFDVIALEVNGSLLFARRYKKWAAPRQWAEVRLEKRKHEFPHCQYMQFPKKSQEGFCDERWNHRITHGHVFAFCPEKDVRHFQKAFYYTTDIFLPFFKYRRRKNVPAFEKAGTSRSADIGIWENSKHSRCPDTRRKCASLPYSWNAHFPVEEVPTPLSHLNWYFLDFLGKPYDCSPYFFSYAVVL